MGPLYRTLSALPLVLVAATAAHAASPLCGTTLTADLALTEDLDCTGFTGTALTVGADNITIEGNGYRLLAPDASRGIEVSGRANVTIHDLEVSGWCTGTGIYLQGGSNLTLAEVTVDGRQYGVDASGVAGLAISDLTVTAAGQVGLQLANITTLSLANLTLTDNGTGLQLSNFTGPFTLGPAALTNLTRNDTSLRLANVKNVTVTGPASGPGLAFDGASYGINANNSGNQNLTFQHLRLAAYAGGGGYGLYLQGKNHVVDDVIVTDRGIGIQADSAENLTLSHLSASRITAQAFWIRSPTLPLTLLDLSATDSGDGLYLESLNAPAATPFQITKYLNGSGIINDFARNDRPLLLVSSSYVDVFDLTLDGYTTALYGSGHHLTFSNLDLSSLGPRRGYGLELYGDFHEVDHVTANYRTYGVRAQNTGSLSLTDVTARGCTSGVLLYAFDNTTLPPTLDTLTLTDNDTGLELASFNATSASPYTLDPSMKLNLSGSLTGIRLTYTSYVTLEDLVLPNPVAGVAAYNSTSFITLDGVNVSGNGTGTGLSLDVTGLTVTNVTAHDRVSGARLSGLILSITNLSASRNQTGLWLSPKTTAPTLSGLHLTDNGTALWLESNAVPLVIDDTTGLDAAASDTGIQLAYVNGLTFSNLTLDNTVCGICQGQYYQWANNLTFDNVDVSGPGTGTGLYVQGSGTNALSLAGVTANNRVTGVNLAAMTSLAIEDLEAQGNTYGLVLTNNTAAAAPPTFQDLNLRHNNVAVYLGGLVAPMTFDGADAIDVSQSNTGFLFANYYSSASGLTFRNLVLNNPVAGISTGNDATPLFNCLFEDIDASGTGSGDGISISGSNLILHRVIANDRSTGISLRGVRYGGTIGHTIDDLVAHHNGVGLAISGRSDDISPPNLRKLDLSDNTTALSLSGITAPPTSPWSLGPYPSAPPYPSGSVTGADEAIVSLARAGTSIATSGLSNVILHDLTLDGRNYGLYSYSGSITLEDVDVSGNGKGTGIWSHGATLTLTSVTANDRATGTNLNYGANHSITDFTSERSQTGLYLFSPTLPFTLSGLKFTDCGTGLQTSNVIGSSPPTLGPAHFATGWPAGHGNRVAISTSLAVDAAALGLVGSGTYTDPPATDPAPCGTTLMIDTTLTADLSCPHTTGTVLTLGTNGITFDGAGFKIDAPFATTVIASSNSNVTAKNVDVSGRIAGPGNTFGLSLTGPDNVVANVIASRRGVGVSMTGARPTVTGLTTEASTTGLFVNNVSAPLTLSGLALKNGGTGLDLRNFDGLVGGSPTTLGSAVFTSLAGNATSIYLGFVQNVALQNLTLDGMTYGLQADSSSDLTLTNIDADGQAGLGTGVSLSGGARHTLTDVTANHRNVGAQTNNTSALSITHFSATDTATYGLRLGTTSTQAAPLLLTDLTLSRSAGAALFLNGVLAEAGHRLIIDPYIPNVGGVLTDVSGSATSIAIDAAQYVTFKNLRLDGRNYGIEAWGYAWTNNQHLRYQNLDVSAPSGESAGPPPAVWHRRGVGTGLWARGSDLLIEDVTANGRNVGVSAGNNDGLTIRRVTANSNAADGLLISSAVSPPLLEDLTLEDNGQHALSLDTLGGTVGNPFTIGPYVANTGGAIRSLAGSATGIYLSAVHDLLLHDLTLANRSNGLYTNPYTTSINVTIRDVDASYDHYTGYGLYLTKTTQSTVERVTAHRRAYGLIASATSDLHVTTFASRGSSTGFQLANFAAGMTAPTLNGLDLRDSNGAGLSLSSNHNVPMTIGPNQGINLGGGVGSGIDLYNNSGLTFDGGPNRTALQLDQPNYGLYAYYDNSNLTFQNLDLSGRGTYLNPGIGIELAGPNHTLTNIKATRRGTSVRTTQTSGGLTITNLTSRQNGTGLLLRASGAALPPTLSGLTLTDNTYALYVMNWDLPFTFDPSIGLDTTGSLTGIGLAYASNATLDGFTLNNRSYGVNVEWIGNNLTFRNLTLNGTGRGYGIYILYGSGIHVENVTANNRLNGLYSNNHNSLQISAFSAANSRGAGMDLRGISVAPTLTDLSLTGGNTGLRLSSLTGPLLLDDNVLSDLSGNLYGVGYQAVSNLTFQNLRIDAPGGGLVWDWLYENNLTIDHVDVTGSCRGTGISLWGSNNQITNSTVARRTTGISQSNGDHLAITDSVIAANGTGISIGGGSLIPNTAVVADAANSTTQIKVTTVANMTVGMTLRVALPGGDEDRVVSALPGNNVITFSAPLSAIPDPGTTVRGTDFGSPRVTVDSSDICANGTGLTASNQSVDADSNYWRASTGPKHSNNPGGTGDTIYGTATTYTPFQAVPGDKANDYCNQAPVADPGTTPQSACEGDTVTLDGSASADPDVEPLTYLWASTSGQGVAITNAGQAVATFVAPGPTQDQVGATQTLGLTLTVKDDVLERRALAEVVVAIRNKAPVVAAGADQSVVEGALVALSGSASDPEGGALTTQWVQVGGSPVSLSDASALSPTFTAPDIAGGAPGDVTLTFELRANDVAPAGYCGGVAQGVDTIVVTVSNRVRPPVADAGSGQTVPESTGVTLPGTGSSDPDGDALTYAWVQRSGVGVTLTGADTATPTFLAPTLDCVATATLVFELTVDDGFGGSDSDTVSITVQDTEPDGDGDGVVDCADSCPDDVNIQTGPCAICGNGVVEVGEACDGGACCAASCVFEVAGHTCGSGATECSGEDTCDGAGACLPNHLNVGTSCGDAGTECRNQDTCDGAGACTDNAFKASGTACGSGASGECDAADSCDGSGGCQLNHAVAGTSCGSGTVTECDAADSCDAAGVCQPNHAADGVNATVTSCGIGACAANGFTTCSGGVVGNTCVPGAAASSDSDCDNIDDDCDGAADEDYVAISSCFLPGACAAGNAASSCVAGVETACQTGTPAPSDGTCDNVDDDCSGTADEDYDGTPTSCGVGACAATGVTTCTAGVTGNTCTPDTPASSDSDCDNIDDDCDGAIDDDDQDGDTTPDCTDGCPTDPNKLAPALCGCGVADDDDDADGTVDCFDPCPSDPNPNAGLGAETCDGVDNDCNQAIDDGLTRETSCGIGACANNTGSETCTLGVWGDDSCDPFEGAVNEVCNGLDDDCDELADEDIAPTPVACGVDACALGEGVTTCVGGVAGDTCDALWSDIPDTTCGAAGAGLNVLYIIATNAAGAPVGSIRCFQDLAAAGTPVRCDTEPGTARLVVRPELLCEGVTP